VSKGSKRPFRGGERVAWSDRIWKAQGKVCPICGVGMVPVHRHHPTSGWTIEHCWPRSRYRFEHRGNILVTHSRCNCAKGDRDPTGCELIMLEAVNATLGWKIEKLTTSYADVIESPSALALALIAAQERTSLRA
jgi:hypothetical protein